MGCGCQGGASWTPPPTTDAYGNVVDQGSGPRAPGYYASPDGKTVVETNAQGAERVVPVGQYPAE